MLLFADSIYKHAPQQNTEQQQVSYNSVHYTNVIWKVG